ncbi:hypothetical protein [Streptomyces sp. FZ201]|uniref:hypothetical protein n=1 Tax=Streptomyces sp. FZ201 TaxID=3057122 RepID=UPI0021BE2134|nr:hypothetical protein [Streptomyces sp. FZ201]
MRDNRTPGFVTGLPTPQETLARTNWAELNHAYGRATDAPRILGGLLDEDQAVRTEALDDLHHVLHHQNTLYEATVPAALYVAALLPDVRMTLPVDKSRHSFPGCLRAELLAWIGSIAAEVGDTAEVAAQRLGFPLDDYPPAVALRELRPALFTAACAFLDDADRHVREAAIAACVPLLDDARLSQHRGTLVPLLRQVLGTSELWQHREWAIDALDAWGQDSTGLEGQQNPFLVCDTELQADDSPWRPGAGNAQGWSEELPF